ncbi:hypothetical protein OB13_15410 [Pontibacter sp. HJ8]
MKVYRNNQSGFREIRQKALKISLPIALLSILTGFGISYYNTGGSDLGTLPFMLLVGGGAVGFGMFKGLNRQRILFNSYTLTIDENFLQREQLHTPTVRIAKEAIQEIVRYPNGSFHVKGIQPADIIIMSHHLEPYDEMVATLQEFGNIRNAEIKSLQQKLLLLGIPLGLVLMAIVYISTNKYLVFFSGTALVSGLAWSVYQVWTSKNVDKKTKRSMWWSLLIILSLLGIMYVKVAA